MLLHVSEKNWRKEKKMSLERDEEVRLILQRELAEHAEVLRFFKSLPVDLKSYVQGFHKSQKPVRICLNCMKHHYPIFCFGFCTPRCFLATKTKWLWYHGEDYSSFPYNSP